jgi:uncharacterized Zn-binding protein involved in type VI secretion
MAFAARVGDQTNHGGVVTGPGIATVKIGGMPAATLGDQHTCSIPPPPPHPTVTPFTMGSASVKIGGKPALRTNDLCGCGASVIVGCLTVKIG